MSEPSPEQKEPCVENSAENDSKGEVKQCTLPAPAPEMEQVMTSSSDDVDLFPSGEDFDDTDGQLQRLTLLERVRERNFSPVELRYRIRTLGEDVNAVEDSGEGYGPIHYIAEGRQIKKYTKELLVVLTIYGNADLDLTATRSGQTALHIAAENNNLECVKTLISLGADVNKEDLLRNTPYDIAKLKKVHRLRSTTSDTEIKMQEFYRDQTSRKPGLEETVEITESTAMSTKTTVSMMTEEKSEILKALESVGGRVGNVKTPPTKRAELSTKSTVPLAMHRIDCLHYKDLEDDINEKLHDECFDPKLEPKQAVTLVQKLQQKAGYQTKYGSRILCLDGGGIRGLVQMTILQEIERKTGKRITDLFDWIVGTSTGGVVALALCYGPRDTGRKSVRQLRDIYWIAKDDVFQEGGGDGLFDFSKGNSEKLESLLQSWLGKDTKMDRNTHSNYLLPKVLIPAVHKETVELHFFNNCFKNEHFNKLAWKVARYTSAAPFYFKELDNYIDGGVLAANPAEDGLTKIQEFYQQRGEKLPISMVVSIGSGVNPSKPITGNIDVSANVLNLSAWRNIAAVLDQAITSPSTHSNCQSRCREQGIKYFRFNPVLAEAVDSGQKDHKKLLNMLWTTQTYLNQPNVSEEMNKLVQLLKHSALATTPDL